MKFTTITALVATVSAVKLDTKAEDSFLSQLLDRHAAFHLEPHDEERLMQATPPTWSGKITRAR